MIDSTTTTLSVLKNTITGNQVNLHNLNFEVIAKEIPVAKEKGHIQFNYTIITRNGTSTTSEETHLILTHTVFEEIFHAGIKLGWVA